jgi:MoaA/NifB/PqqE/SkfB family radical SAM enzyme
MKAKIQPAYDANRVRLGEVLPLDTPFRMTVSPTHFCNMKCFFCTHSLKREDVEKTGFKYRHMSYDEFKMLGDQLREFMNPLKLMVFSGMGEPLLNKDLPAMIAYVKEHTIAEKVEMYSNATVLTPELARQLVVAGLDKYLISIEGMDAEAYKNGCKYKIDYEKNVRNIEYFYQRRNQCKIYIKIIDACLKDGDEGKFYDTYGDICDEIYVEHLSDCQPLTRDCGGAVDKQRTMYNEDAVQSRVCPLLFYTIYADADCNIYPCVTLGLPIHFSIGNFRSQSLMDMWRSEKLKELRKLHLQGLKNANEVCNSCGNMLSMYHKDDDLDSYAGELLKRYQ